MTADVVWETIDLDAANEADTAATQPVRQRQPWDDPDIPLDLFCLEIGLDMDSEFIGPAGGKWASRGGRNTAVEYRVTLTRTGTDVKVETPWHMGMDRDFSAADVLDCLRSDAESGDNWDSLKDAISEYGMDSFDNDINEAQRVFEASKEAARMLREFLGEDMYRDLLERVERL